MCEIDDGIKYALAGSGNKVVRPWTPYNDTQGGLSTLDEYTASDIAELQAEGYLRGVADTLASPELAEGLWALQWALSQLDRGDGVLEYTGPIADGERAKGALAALEAKVKPPAVSETQ